jgi:glyoxylase I family protein
MGAATTPPFAIEGIDHVLLLVEHMPRALAFYQDVLGCEVARRMDEHGMVQLRAGAALIDLVDVATPEGAWARSGTGGGRNMDHLCLATTRWEPDVLRQRLATLGVEIVEEGMRYGARGTGFSIYVRDPSGNTIEIKGPPEEPV